VKRRDFVIGLLLSATTASAQAQQRAKVYRLAVVDPINPLPDLTEAGGLPYYRGFFERLQQLGFVEGGNLEIKRYSAEGHSERLADMVSEVVNLKPDVIFMASTRLLIMLKGATATIPLVGVMADPIRFGLVASLARPGGNIAGVAHDPGIEFYSKRYQLFKELAPRASKLGILLSRPFVEKTTSGARYAEVARRAGFEITLPFEELYWREEDYRPAFDRMAQEGVDGIVVTEQNENWTYRRLIIALAKEFQLPAIYPDRIFVELGGLMSFGVDWVDSGRDLARVVAEIFNGANPANIPISQPTKYELSLNLKTAKALGIEIPPSLLVQADEVIE
jgi:putative tryptophan/tyrosine transport system substrate-binding protein